MTRVWMVVEDDPTVRAIFSMSMTLWGVTPLVFQTGQEAVDWLARVERGDGPSPLPEVAILDLRLPDIMGHEIGRRMRTLPATAHIPIVLMTAYDLRDSDQRLIEQAVHPDEIIFKPLPMPEEFRARIERTIADCRDRHKTRRHTPL